MKAKKVSQQEMEKALEIVNEKYQGNVKWNRFDKNGNGFNFTLKVKDFKAPGHRLHIRYDDPFKTCIQKTHRSSHACWHVHGDFFDALFSINPNAVIYSNGNKITKDEGNWQDRNIGSQMFPVYYSESCECE